MRSMVEGAPRATMLFYRKKVVRATGAPIVTPTACHFPRLGRGKLIRFQSLPRAPRGRGTMRSMVEGGLWAIYASLS